MISSLLLNIDKQPEPHIFFVVGASYRCEKLLAAVAIQNIVVVGDETAKNGGIVLN